MEEEGDTRRAYAERQGTKPDHGIDASLAQCRAKAQGLWGEASDSQELCVSTKNDLPQSKACLQGAGRGGNGRD